MQRYKISIKREQKNEFYLPSVRKLSNFFVIYCSIAPTFLYIKAGARQICLII